MPIAIKIIKKGEKPALPVPEPKAGKAPRVAGGLRPLPGHVWKQVGVRHHKDGCVRPIMGYVGK